VYADRGKLVFSNQYRVVDLPGLWVGGKYQDFHGVSLSLQRGNADRRNSQTNSICPSVRHIPVCCPDE